MQGFYWDNVFAGTANMYRLTSTRIMTARSLTEDPVREAWAACKLHHPLIGASIFERDDDPPTPAFVVRRETSRTARPDEVSFDDRPGTRSDVEDLLRRLHDPEGPRCLSNDLLSRVYVRCGANEEYPMADGQVWHFVLVKQHCISDGVAFDVLSRYFFERLAHALASQSTPLPPSEDAAIAARLAVVPPVESLNPTAQFSRAKRRWKTAMAKSLLALRISRLQGGHSLPKRVQVPTAPASSAHYRIHLSPETTVKVLNGCRKHRITFNGVLGVLEQLAHARVLHRLRLAGRIGDDEWFDRLAQPMQMAGPLNLRPSLDKRWKENPEGGMNQVFCAINFFAYTLPPLPRAAWALSRPHPSNSRYDFDALLSEDRFWHRASLVADQLRSTVRHPLFVDLCFARLPQRILSTRTNALRYRRSQQGLPVDWKAGPIATSTTAGSSYVMSNGGSSLGDISAANPRIFRSALVGRTITPAEDDAPQASIEILTAENRLHCRPGELYCGASTDKSLSSGGKNVMSLFCFFDSNVYETGMVREWVDEVKGAAEHYFRGYSSEWPGAKM